MKKTTRRGAIKVSGFAFAATPFLILKPAIAADFSFKYANNLLPDHPITLRMKEAASLIYEETGGRVAIHIFPNNQLGSDTDLLHQLRIGAIQLFNLSGIILSTLVPAASINGVGFAFKDLQTAWAAMDGALGTYVRAKISSSGLYALRNIWDNGFRQITTSSKPIVTTEDFYGLKIRVPVSPLWISMFKALGASPTSINWSETYSALQTRIVDGQENSLSVISYAKLYEVQKYCSLTNHMWDGFWCLANSHAWEQLPDHLRIIVETQINAGALAHRRDVITTSTGVQTDLTKSGLVFNAPRTAPIREKLREAGFYKQWRSNYGEEAWALLENISGELS